MSVVITRTRRKPFAIYIGKQIRKIGRWEFMFYYGRDIVSYDRKRLLISWIKLKGFPEMGATIQKKDYHGFLFDKSFYHPLTRLRFLLEDFNF